MLIGLMGKARAGKDTFANILKPLGFERLSFADALYQEASELSGLSVEFLRENKDKLAVPEWDAVKVTVARKMQSLGDYDEVPETIRFFLQDLGLLRRQSNSEYWVDIIVAIIDAHPKQNYVITDVRFENEYLAVLKKSGILVRILRQNLIPIGEEASQHISETALDSFIADYTLHNDGKPEDMLVQLMRSPDNPFRRLCA